MKLLKSIQHLKTLENGVVASIGNFDGVHLGHQSLIKDLRIKANALKLPLALFLFEPQPREYFQKEKAPKRISSLREKLNVLKSCNVDYIYCIKFDAEFANTSAYDFAFTYLFSHSRIKYLLIGEDFRFGRNREGTIGLLKEMGLHFGCDVQIAKDFLIDEEKISSTTIRNLLIEGKLTQAAQYLGRLYSLCGSVVYGHGRGRQWGIPTANIHLLRLSLPVQGVFAVEAELDTKRIKGVANVGKRPTIDGSKMSLEIHLFDFAETIYGKWVQVFFLHKLREEIKFSAVDELIKQINHDIRTAQAFFNHHNQDLIFKE